MVIHPGDPVLVLFHLLGSKVSITIARRTQLQRAIASDIGLLGKAVASVNSRLGLIFIVAEVMGLSALGAASTLIFQQPVELVEIFRGF